MTQEDFINIVKDKAKELVDKYYTTLLPNVRMRKPIAIQHALISVDELIKYEAKHCNLTPLNNEAEYYLEKWAKEYWQEVKNELLKQKNNQNLTTNN